MVYWIINAIALLTFSAFLLVVWFEKMWIIFSRPNDELSCQIKVPKSRVARGLYTLSNKIMRSAVARFLIYIISIVLLGTSAIVHVAECCADCTIGEQIHRATPVLMDHPCMNSWAVTQSVILAICTTFMFIRVHFIFKLLIASIIVGIYSWIIFAGFNHVFEQSASINASLNAKVAHLLTVIFVSVIFHLVDRQAEYISKIDYK